MAERAASSPESASRSRSRLKLNSRDARRRWAGQSGIPSSAAWSGGRNVNGVPVKIVQTADLIVMLYEEPAGDFRQVLLDGHQLPKDPDPTRRAYSVGRWDGDALVVETSGFNDRVWLNITAYPHTKALRVTERYRRPHFGSLELQMTIDDPGAYTKPWTVTASKQLLVDTELLEYVCENNTVATGRGK